MDKSGNSQIERISAATLKQKTGKTWDEWFIVLKDINANQLSHKEIANYLESEQKLNPWWAQMVTVGFEQYIGRRQPHEKPNGYEISVSKTINASVSSVFKCWQNEDARRKWLAEAISIRKATDNKSLRITWTDNITQLIVNFYEKGESKSQVVVQHSKIANANAAEKQKQFWKEKLTQLAQWLVNN